MVVVVTRDVADRYRGFLASCMLEIAPGVYTAPRMTAGVRERSGPSWRLVRRAGRWLRRDDWRTRKAMRGKGAADAGHSGAKFVELDGGLITSYDECIAWNSLPCLFSIVGFSAFYRSSEAPPLTRRIDRQDGPDQGLPGQRGSPAHAGMDRCTQRGGNRRGGPKCSFAPRSEWPAAHPRQRRQDLDPPALAQPAACCPRRLHQADSSPTMPRRKVRTQTTKIAPCTTVTQAPSWVR